MTRATAYWSSSSDNYPGTTTAIFFRSTLHNKSLPSTTHWITFYTDRATGPGATVSPAFTSKWRRPAGVFFLPRALESGDKQTGRQRGGEGNDCFSKVTTRGWWGGRGECIPCNPRYYAPVTVIQITHFKMYRGAFPFPFFCTLIT